MRHLRDCYGLTPEKYLGGKGWKKTGAENIPPIIARGALFDMEISKGPQPKNYRITASDLQEALKKQQSNLAQGDVVPIRTGQSQFYVKSEQNLDNYPGISLDAVKWLVEDQKIMLLRADNKSFKAFPLRKGR